MEKEIAPKITAVFFKNINLSNDFGRKLSPENANEYINLINLNISSSNNGMIINNFVIEKTNNKPYDIVVNKYGFSILPKINGYKIINIENKETHQKITEK